ncbi:lipopolysaccharide biosynthesis, partial [Rhodobacteraceae bacterium]|nr:lipopolysaccharide biosynthesis [Paracoccaceae bacterium]
MNADIKFYYQLMLRRLPVMAVIFTLCAGIGVALAMTLPKRYAAEATLSVEGAIIPSDQRANSVGNESVQQLQSIRARLLSRANLIDIANKYRVFASEGAMTADEVVVAMREQTKINVRSGRGQATIMEISFTSSRAAAAADVVNEYVTIVLAEDAEYRIGQSRETLEFRVGQVDRLDDKLSKLSADIVRFKQANKESLPEGLDYRLDRLSTLQERLNLAARDRASLISQRDRLQAMGVPLQDNTIPLTPDQQQLQVLEGELNGALAIYSEANPRVRLLRARVKQLTTKVAASTPQPSGAGIEEVPSAPATLLDLQLAEIDARLASLDSDIARAETQSDALRITIEGTPAVAIRLDELEREYINTQTLYNQAVAERARAENTDQIEENRKGERLEVIEQAVAPSSPNSPNRKLVAGGGVFMGAGLAGVFFLLTELLNRSIRRPVDLTRAFGIQPLATIPYLENASKRRRRRALKV